MKKLNLVFVFALMGVLFFACQKDERVVESIQDSELESTNRTPWADPYIFDFTDCLDDGGCPCRLINMNQTGWDIDMCTELFHYHYNGSWTYGQGLNLWDFSRVPPGGLNTCNILMNDCNPSYAGGLGMVWQLESNYIWQPGSSSADHYFFPHHGVIPFCFLPQGYIKICNPEIVATEWHLVCELDTDPRTWQTFFIPPGQCKLFYVGSDCSVEECEEI